MQQEQRKITRMTMHSMTEQKRIQKRREAGPLTTTIHVAYPIDPRGLAAEQRKCSQSMNKINANFCVVHIAIAEQLQHRIRKRAIPKQ